MTNVYMYVNANRLVLIRESDWGAVAFIRATLTWMDLLRCIAEDGCYAMLMDNKMKKEKKMKRNEVY